MCCANFPQPTHVALDVGVGRYRFFSPMSDGCVQLARFDKKGGSSMTESQAHEILNRVRAGDKTPTLSEINLALVLCGDITSLLSPLVSHE